MAILDEEFKTLNSLQARAGREAVVRLIGHYFTGMRDMQSRLQAMKNAIDLEGAKMVAHRMRGACGSLGFHRLAVLFTEMDEAADREDIESIAGLIDIVKKESALLETAIRARYPETVAPASEN